MTDERTTCPECGAGFSHRPYKRNGWIYAECGRRWHREHGWEPVDPPQCLRRQVDRLRAALAPFAAAAEHMAAGKACDPEELGIWSDQASDCRVTVADFKRAAEAADED